MVIAQLACHSFRDQYIHDRYLGFFKPLHRPPGKLFWRIILCLLSLAEKPIGKHLSLFAGSIKSSTIRITRTVLLGHSRVSKHTHCLTFCFFCSGKFFLILILYDDRCCVLWYVLRCHSFKCPTNLMSRCDAKSLQKMCSMRKLKPRMSCLRSRSNLYANCDVL